MFDKKNMEKKNIKVQKKKKKVIRPSREDIPHDIYVVIYLDHVLWTWISFSIIYSQQK